MDLVIQITRTVIVTETAGSISVVEYYERGKLLLNAFCLGFEDGRLNTPFLWEM